MIIIDSNTWIFAENDTADEHEIAALKIHQMLNSTGFGINSVIVSEVFHILSRLLGADEAGRRVVNIIEHPAAQWLEFSLATVKEALALATQKQLRINDALIAQQAIETKVGILTDNIKDFKKIKGLKLIKLR